jgi:hypothetical protein
MFGHIESSAVWHPPVPLGSQTGWRNWSTMIGKML